MFDTLFNTEIANMTITVGQGLKTAGCAILLGMLISFTYLKTNKTKVSGNFIITLLLLPLIMGSVIMLIGNNIAGAFSMAGIFSIIKFRSEPANAKDILLILICVLAGLSCALFAYTFGIIITLVLCITIYIVSTLNIGVLSNNDVVLKILVPEDIANNDVFDEVIRKYTNKFNLTNIRTRNLGSIYEFTYELVLNENTNRIEMIDELRCKNSNLNIIMNKKEIMNEF